MSIIIQNTGRLDGDHTRYALRINQKVICEFNHERKTDGLAQCLCDAAHAADKVANERQAELLKLLFI